MTMQSEIIGEIEDILRSEVSDVSDAVAHAVDKVEHTFTAIEISIIEVVDSLDDGDDIESIKQRLEDLYKKV